MRVLVTGAAGYLGWAVAHELLASGDEVIALIHHSDAGLPADVKKRHADLLDPDSLTAIMAGVEGVCHLAALTQVRPSTDQPTLYYRVNVGGTIGILDAMAAESRRSGNAGRIVLASTGQIYGAPARQPICEDAEVRFINPYAASKVAAEQLLGWQAATGAVGAATLRIFNAAGAAVGRGDRDLTRIIPRAVAVATGSAQQVDVNGDGTAIRDFVHVRDVARAFVQALHACEPGQHAVYNVGATPASVRDVIAAVERIIGRNVAVQHRVAHSGEAPTLTADTSKIRGALGWRPVSSGLDDLVQSQWSAAADRALGALSVPVRLEC
jgi:UDP-glucose 4-epimerase